MTEKKTDLDYALSNNDYVELYPSFHQIDFEELDQWIVILKRARSEVWKCPNCSTWNFCKYDSVCQCCDEKKNKEED